MAVLLTCLLFSSQVYAITGPTTGQSMEEAIEVRFQGDHFSCTKSGRYNIGFFSQLFLYYKMYINRSTSSALTTSAGLHFLPVPPVR